MASELIYVHIGNTGINVGDQLWYVCIFMSALLCNRCFFTNGNSCPFLQRQEGGSLCQSVALFGLMITTSTRIRILILFLLQITGNSTHTSTASSWMAEEMHTPTEIRHCRRTLLRKKAGFTVLAPSSLTLKNRRASISSAETRAAATT